MSSEQGFLHSDPAHAEVTWPCFGLFVLRVALPKAAGPAVWVVGKGTVPPSHGRGSLSSVMSQGGCHYWGYIDGFPSSAVTLNTCSGLR